MKKIQNLFVFFVILILFNLTIQRKTEPITANIYYSKYSKKFIVKYEPINKSKSLAYIKYTPSYEEEGWDYLSLSSSDKPSSIYSDELNQALLENKRRYLYFI